MAGCPMAETFGSINTGQSFEGGEPPEVTPVVNEFVFNHTGSDTNAFIEVAGVASTDYSALTLVEIEGDETYDLVRDAVGAAAGVEVFYFSSFDLKSQLTLEFRGSTRGKQLDYVDITFFKV